VSEQYRCRAENRRALVAESTTVNGIDFLEVAPDQKSLVVTFLHDFGLGSLTAENLSVEGGVRISGIAVGTPAAAANVLTVPVDRSGDFSNYTFRLRRSATDESPPDGFDPQLAEIEFSFKAGCPSDFDCRPVETCPPGPVSEPPIDYLAKDYARFRRLLLDRLSVLLPDWRERSPADLGITVVELLAYTSDYLSYWQDVVQTEAYLGTARKRVSVRRHTRLLDYAMHDGCNARAWVVLQVAPGSGADGAELPAGTELLTQVAAPRGRLDPKHRDQALREQPRVFATLHPIVLRSAHDEMRFYTWGDDECCLPRGATRATLLDVAGALQLAPRDVLVFEEKLGPASGRPEDADPLHRHPVRLTKVEKATDQVEAKDVVRIEWHEADALPFPLCLSATIAAEGGDVIVSDVSVAHGNVVLADHGLAVAGETLDPKLVTERYRPRLSRLGLTLAVRYDHEQARTQPAAGATGQDPRRALPSLRLEEAGQPPWRPRRDLLGSDRFARELVGEVESDGTAALRFGDGVFGRMPEPGTELEPVYRVGNGREGNVGADALAHVVWDVDGVTDVRNPLPAGGGIDPEPSEQARLDAPAAFRVQQRAVTESDYGEVAQRHGDVQRAVATRRWTGSWYTMFVTVDRFGGRAVDPEFETELRAFLERFRLAGHDLEIDAPRYVPLDIAMTVCVDPGSFRSDVERALVEAFGAGDLPGGRRGFFHPDNFTFGQPVYLSGVIAHAMQVPGVAWVDLDDTPPKKNRFQRFGELPLGELAAGRIPIGRLEIARLDNDPNAAENGQIEFAMTGGL
jgi:Baseplate J-like protein